MISKSSNINYSELKEVRAQLAEAVLRAALRAYTSGGFDAMRYIGIEFIETEMSNEDVRWLASLTVDELYRTTRLPIGTVMALLLGRRLRALRHLAEKKGQETAEQEELIRAGASLPLMEAEYGMDGVSYADLRRRLGITGNGGRPPLLSEEDEQKLLTLWRVSAAYPSRQRWLIIARAGLPLHSAWATIQKEGAAGDGAEEGVVAAM